MSDFYLCNSAALEADLSKSAFKVYSFLSMGANNKTRSCFHARATIAKQCGISVSTVIRSIKELCAAGLLEVKRRFLEPGKQTTNLYILLDNTQLNIDSLTPSMNNKDLATSHCTINKKKASAASEDKLWPFKCNSSGFKAKLSANELKVYSYLSFRSGNENRCMPSISEIASCCKISVPTVRRAIKVIFNAGLISVIPQTRETTCGNKGTSVNQYVLMQEKINPTACSKSTIQRKPKLTTLLFYYLLPILKPSPLSQMLPQRTISRRKLTLKQRKEYLITKVTKWCKANIYPKASKSAKSSRNNSEPGDSG